MEVRGSWSTHLHNPCVDECGFDLVEERIRVAAQADVGNAQDAIAVDGDGDVLRLGDRTWPIAPGTGDGDAGPTRQRVFW